MGDKAVTLLSGGLNSFVATAFAQHVGTEIVEAICFNYGQANCNEIEAASELADFLNIPFVVLSPEVGYEITDRMTHDQLMDMESLGLNNSFWFGRNLLIHLLGAIRAQMIGVGIVVTGATLSRVDMVALDFLQKAIEASGFGVRFEHPFSSTEPGHAFKVAEAIGVWDQAVIETVDCLRGSLDLNTWGHGCGECEGCLKRIHGHTAAVSLMKSRLEKSLQ